MKERYYQYHLAEYRALITMMDIQFGLRVKVLAAIERSLEKQQAARQHWLEVKTRCDELQAKLDKIKTEWGVE